MSQSVSRALDGRCDLFVVFVVGVDLRELKVGVSQMQCSALLHRCFVYERSIGLTLSYRPDILPVDDVSKTNKRNNGEMFVYG